MRYEISLNDGKTKVVEGSLGDAREWIERWTGRRVYLYLVDNTCPAEGGDGCLWYVYANLADLRWDDTGDRAIGSIREVTP